MQSILIRVLLLSGSLHHPSHTHTNLKHLESLLRKRGVSTYLWDLFSDPLPIHNPEFHRNPHANTFEVVRHLAHLADVVDAFVWGTPDYHDSFSGILKNALDNLNTHQFHHKPVALISNGNMHCSTEPCDQLRIVAHGLLATAIPTQIVTADSDFEYFRDGYVIVNPRINDSFARLTEEVIAYTISLHQLRQEGAKPRQT
ncbi:MAG: NADPH-dependent FMN reductase [Ktedonobacteraceae bacterium]